MHDDQDSVKPTAGDRADALLADEDVEGVIGGVCGPVSENTLGTEPI